MHDDIKQHGGSDDNSVVPAILAMTNLGLQHFPIIVLGYAEDQPDAALFSSRLSFQSYYHFV